jgi:hypothetical protein
MVNYQELESKATDVSDEFAAMDMFNFRDFLKTKRAEQSLKIVRQLSGIEETDRFLMRRFKAFIETAPQGQVRFVTVKATPEQYKKYPNEFTSGINWEKII